MLPYINIQSWSQLSLALQLNGFDSFAIFGHSPSFHCMLLICLMVKHLFENWDFCKCPWTFFFAECTLQTRVLKFWVCVALRKGGFAYDGYLSLIFILLEHLLSFKMTPYSLKSIRSYCYNEILLAILTVFIFYSLFSYISWKNAAMLKSASCYVTCKREEKV